MTADISNFHETEFKIQIKNAIPDLGAIFGIYAQSYLESLNDADYEAVNRNDASGEKEVEELLIKLIRLAANVAIDPESGFALSAMIELELLIDLLENAEITEHEELILNAIGALANLSYYTPRTYSEKNCILIRAEEMTKLFKDLIPLLVHDNTEIVAESARIFGNISRMQMVASYLASHRGSDIFENV
ncbi:Armadillo repeat-containing protein 2 [Nowakowskiella sp. JEL0407]|nr:Armadillo repeat-containing protein 2 [Nowakowskiella sp. JEL0407]